MISQADITENEGVSSELVGTHTPQSARDPLKTHGHKSRERLNIASGELKDPKTMVRLAFAPDGQVVADVYAKLPGRGAWIEANRAAVEQAAKSGAFARAAKRKVLLADNFADAIEASLSAQLLAMIGMAKRAGQLESGFENVRTCARKGAVGVRIEACDGQPDGRSKIRVVIKAISNELELPMPTLIGCFDSKVLGKVVGRDNMVHACVTKGKMAKAIEHVTMRLAGFRQMVPNEWPDKAHET